MKRATANKYLSWYILLRDAIRLAKERPGINRDGRFTWCQCCTCGKMIDRFKSSCHAGHFFPKGMGGSSGAYYDETNVHAQCHSCNDTLEGNRTEYWPFMAARYGPAHIERLRVKHKLPRPLPIGTYGTFYLEAYKNLLAKHKLEYERRKRKVGKAQ
jgi:hypothetical protein